MVDDPLQELRDIRRNMEHVCAEKGQTYAEYLSQAQCKYTKRLSWESHGVKKTHAGKYGELTPW